MSPAVIDTEDMGLEHSDTGDTQSVRDSVDRATRTPFVSIGVARKVEPV